MVGFEEMDTRKRPERSLSLAWFKVAVSTPICLLGLLLPHLLRVVYSEVLGWIAQLVPPGLYAVEEKSHDADPDT